MSMSVSVFVCDGVGVVDGIAKKCRGLGGRWLGIGTGSWIRVRARVEA